MVDPANTPLGRMLLDEITPVVMVLRTNLVEETCQKNGLSLIQMLSPFCAFDNIDVPVRTASDQPYRLQKFKLRLFYASDIRQPDVEELKKELLHSASQSELIPSWFPFFNKELVRTVSFSDHEAFDHPVACLLVVSSKDEEPINRFVDLFNSDQLPSLLSDGAMDPKILKYYLLLHDNQDGTSEKTTKFLTEMRSTFGSNDCGLLCVNSSQDGLVEHQENPWALHRTESSPNHRLGCFLNIDDMDELQNVMQDLSSKHIIPHMEQKIRVLNQQVSATRRGFRNQIKNLWWRKGKEDTPDTQNGPMYTFSSIESQIRVLGDYAFMLRDYELALSNYRLLSTDYKIDKVWKRYAGVQEMMGLTYFMLDQSSKDAEYCMENAFNTYLGGKGVIRDISLLMSGIDAFQEKLGSSGQRIATRCGLWWVEMLKTRDQFKEAATVYFRISGEEPLHSAVMLEQASYCYLFAKPPMLRKYGFHLVLSGDLYKKCDQMKHAIRTYRGALTVFEGTKWSHIRDHVHFHIGKWYAFLGMFDVAINHTLEVLACGHQSKTTQELFLRDFFQIVQKTGKTFEVSMLQLPVIDIPSLKVVFEDHRTYASSEAVGVKESLWRSLEEDIMPSLPTIRSNWLEPRAKLLSKKLKESNVCVAGEAIKVEIGFKNPLQIPISISSVSLICEHSARSDEIEVDPNGTSTENQNDDQFRKLATSGECSSEMSSFTVSEVDISLGGGETLLAQLTVTPRLEGTLKIVGVRWKLSGSVAGFFDFNSDLVKKKVAKKRRKTTQPTTDNLEFLVIKTLPKLEGCIRHLPKTVYAGDLRLLDLVLRNPFETSVKSIKMKINHPRFLSIGNQEVMDMEFPACLEKMNSAESDARVKTNSTSDTVFLFPEVLPSLDLSFQISHCPSRLQEFLVRMDVVNRTSSKSFQVHQLSSVGNKWEISLLQPIDSIFPSELLLAGQALSCFFKLKNGRNSVIDKDEDYSISTLEGSDIRLSCSSNEPLFDIYSIANTSPIWWLMEGPRTIHHNFSSSFCKIKLKMTVHNSSDAVASIRIERSDSTSSANTTSVPSGNEAGWHDISLLNDVKVTSDVLGTRVGKSLPQECVSPFIWSGTSSTRFKLEPMSTTEIPLQICVFSPGTYDLSNYILHWNCLPSNDQVNQRAGGTKKSSGTCQGHPYYLTVLQSS
ncbi:hypothetical protein TEA_015437 [Camellia sinensis var. sinensis]|uniref:Trafficking protein particle complex subunit 8 n=1 Tax=Camellia sinensis var. sinensis TaxID=542762 RepID=A0A4S4D2C3_CAMSN|nr:hypothetical protein TEA_015437 [Camellia sinensis var. sinensis]